MFNFMGFLTVLVSKSATVAPAHVATGGKFEVRGAKTGSVLATFNSETAAREYAWAVGGKVVRV